MSSFEKVIVVVYCSVNSIFIIYTIIRNEAIYRIKKSFSHNEEVLRDNYSNAKRDSLEYQITLNKAKKELLVVREELNKLYVKYEDMRNELHNKAEE